MNVGFLPTGSDLNTRSPPSADHLPGAANRAADEVLFQLDLEHTRAIFRMETEKPDFADAVLVIYYARGHAHPLRYFLGSGSMG